jgi:hypothetical protein
MENLPKAASVTKRTTGFSARQYFTISDATEGVGKPVPKSPSPPADMDSLMRPRDKAIFWAIVMSGLQGRFGQSGGLYQIDVLL